MPLPANAATKVAGDASGAGHAGNAVQSAPENQPPESADASGRNHSGPDAELRSQLRETLLDLLSKRAAGATCCPSEVRCSPFLRLHSCRSRFCKACLASGLPTSPLPASFSLVNVRRLGASVPTATGARSCPWPGRSLSRWPGRGWWTSLKKGR